MELMVKIYELLISHDDFRKTSLIFITIHKMRWNAMYVCVCVAIAPSCSRQFQLFNHCQIAKWFSLVSLYIYYSEVRDDIPNVSTHTVAHREWVIVQCIFISNDLDILNMHLHFLTHTNIEKNANNFHSNRENICYAILKLLDSTT